MSNYKDLQDIPSVSDYRFATINCEYFITCIVRLVNGEEKHYKGITRSIAYERACKDLTED